MAEDIIREVTFSSYPKTVLLNAFRGKTEDKRVIAVKRQWRSFLTSSSFQGCSLEVRGLHVPRIHRMTLTKSTRYQNAWQLTHYDEKGPYSHCSYSDLNKDAGHKLSELIGELAGYSADRTIIARVHFSASENARARGMPLDRRRNELWKS